MKLIDSHCHLFYDSIYKNLDEKIANAISSGVHYMLTVATNFHNSSLNIEISQKYKNVCCSAGIHPYDFDDQYDKYDWKPLLSNKEVVAIGEVGLDYYRENAIPKEKQVALFRHMLDLSHNFDFPYIIHARECFSDILDILKDYQNIYGVFHCYTDSIENAKKILDAGFFISFAGIVTFKNLQDLRDVLKYVPDDRLLIETDCPYLAPEPFRGKSNEPAYLPACAQCVADVRKVSIEHIADITVKNFFTLFQKADFLLENC